MSEWLKEHAWKACVGETLPRVRIPLSPPFANCCRLLPLVPAAFRALQPVPEPQRQAISPPPTRTEWSASPRDSTGRFASDCSAGDFWGDGYPQLSSEEPCRCTW